MEFACRLTQTAMTSSRFTISTPIYYANATPHVGSAYTTMAADVVARYQRLQGKTVKLVTGTDEHGQKIQRTAEAAGHAPLEHCDGVVQEFHQLWELLNIRPYEFVRTSSDRHKAMVRDFFQRVWDRGDIYLGQQQGWYCVGCEEFKEEKDLLEDHFCPLHPTQKVEWRDEANYFFRLSHYQAQLEQLYGDRPEFIQPTMRRNEVLSFVSQGLQDFSISRVNVSWGIPFPQDPKHTIYVWFDALLSYLTGLVEETETPSVEAALAQGWPMDLHLIGKDILRFHAIYWPAMLMSAGLPLPEKIFSHGFLTKDGRKMGKSTGNVLDPFALLNQYGPDAVRYYFLKEIEFGQDGDFAEQRFVTTLNADLANDLGNLLNRTLGMVTKYSGGVIPPQPEEVAKTGSPLAKIGYHLGNEVSKSYANLAFSEVCEAVMTLVRTGNKYIAESAPWTLYKQGQIAQVEGVLYDLLEAVRLAAYLLSPIIPSISSEIYKQLGFSVNFNDQSSNEIATPYSSHGSWGILPVGQTLGAAKPVFQKLELPVENLP